MDITGLAKTLSTFNATDELKQKAGTSFMEDVKVFIEKSSVGYCYYKVALVECLRYAWHEPAIYFATMLDQQDQAISLCILFNSTEVLSVLFERNIIDVTHDLTVTQTNEAAKLFTAIRALTTE